MRFLCRCSCGQTVKVQARHVMRGATKSCGCFRNEALGALNKKLRQKSYGWASFVMLYNQYRSTARKTGRLFELSQEEFRKLTQSCCNYCGAKPAQEICAGYGSYRYNGIDRQDNDLGYTTANSVSCCYRCNRAKATSTVQEFETWLDAACAYRQQGIVGRKFTARKHYFVCNGGCQKKQKATKPALKQPAPDVTAYLEAKRTAAFRPPLCQGEYT